MENGNKDSCSCCSYSRIYEDFMPTSELVHGKDYDTLLLNLPGFKKEEVKIQLCKKTGILKINGQRPVNKFLSFQKDIPVSKNCDKSKINARLVNGILYVKHPKLIISSQKNENDLPTSTNIEPKQDNKKTELDELSKQDIAEKPNNTSPKSNEQTQVVKRNESMKDDATTRTSSDLFAKLKVSRQVMNMAVAALVVLGVGGYVMRSSKKAKE
ncbi:inactive protein RESTRICTED TEV MOVEMENT 2-like isoform X3 [Solanum tuberosum]|uniref:Hsp20/alpha crystallin family protein n=1 Tax=Solanum tuberosum TaxID=4113 RepID=M1AGS9_SOLTU|nr:PREDICTED: inactive protein RESTRICTED TEV MOVEMENT 2-like isoform X3 [Solanum tuberosum]